MHKALNGKGYVKEGEGVFVTAAGEAYAYRLRISAPQPDYALRVVPSRVMMRGPITDRSPLSTLRNCGTSSMVHFRMNWPTFVMRGSLSTLRSTSHWCS